jgi:WD40 repeat protein
MTDEQGTQTYDLFISYAEADRAWVEGYLLDALLQAGVRCHSEAAFALGVPRLLEFERAVQQSQRVLLILSPAYLAEGFTQFADLLAQSYGLETTTWPVIPLTLHPADLPPRLAMLTGLNATDPDTWPHVLERLLADLQRPVPGPAPRPPCPYPGMVPFSEADSHRFFGRDEETRELLERLRLHPFITVIGPSGSGKSSLVFAGLVPALRQSGLFGSGEWLVRSMRPGQAPLEALAHALDGDPAHLDQAVAELLRRVRSNDLSRSSPAATETATANDRLLLVVDQFEELFGPDVVDRVPFQEALLRLARAPDCSVVLTVRADFYPDLMASPLWHQIQAHRFEVLPLDEDGLREAIVRPAEDVGVFVETALVERLVADAAGEPGILPLVQETMVLLWERVERRYLPLRAYEALVLPRRAYGAPPLTGLQVAMARRADAAVADLTAEQQAIARRIFLRLVQFGEGRADTRRQQPAAALRSARDDPDAFEETLHHLADHRLLTLSGEVAGADRQVDIAHEALISGWPELQRWLGRRREAEQTRRRLEAKVVEWQRLGQGSAGLLGEVELLEAERWLESPDAVDLGYGEPLSALVEASRAAREEAAAQRRRVARFRLGALGAIAALVIVALGIGLWSTGRVAQEREAAAMTAEAGRLEALNARATAEAEAEARATEVSVRSTAQADAVAAQATAEAERDRADRQARIAASRQLAAQSANQLDQDPSLALLLSAEALRSADSFEARSALLTGLTYSPRLAAILHGHRYFATSVAFSPDGAVLASGGCEDLARGLGIDLCFQGEVRFWNAANGEQLAVLQGHTGSEFAFVTSLAFSPDGRILASGAGDDTIILWDVESREPLGPPLSGHSGDVTSVAFSPDGRMLASGSRDRSIILWDVETAQPRGQPLTGHGGYVNSIAFSVDGRTLASGSGDRSIILWDVETREPRRQPLIGHTDPVNCIAFSPDEQMLASGSSDGSIILWDMPGGQPLGSPLTGHEGSVLSVAFHPGSRDGRILASSSSDGNIILWDTDSGLALGPPLTGHTDRVNSLAFDPEGTLLASAPGNSNSFSQDNRVILWDVANRKSLGRPLGTLAESVYSLAFSPEDGQVLALGTDDRIILWDVSIGQPLGQPLSGHTDRVSSLAFSPDGQTLTSGSYDGSVVLWDVPSGQPRGQPLTGHPERVTSVAFSPDGQELASLGRDGTTILWDAASGRRLNSLSGPSGLMGSVAFRSDGDVLAAGGESSVILWDVATAKELATLPVIGQRGGYLRVASFSPDFQTFVTVGSLDRTSALQSMADGQLIGPPLATDNLVSSAAFSPDGAMLALGEDAASGSSRGGPGVILWDVVSGQRLGLPLTGHSGIVWSVVFSPDGKTLASGDGAGTVILWDVSPGSWVDRACRIANRNLTQSEWEQFIGPDTPYELTCPDLPPAEGTPSNDPTATD